ncbi:GNAT family N-acetyltransferase [Vulgatibacter sp.]|uniref:GNAT family N-acetyltransferase n=1 Tax=Vulgatibacter sp. TaxID=1971226 RepID=UPI00356840E5
MRAFPVAGAPVEKAAWFFAELCRPDAALEIDRAGRQALVGAVIDTCENAEDEARIEILGLDPALVDEALLREALERAEAIAAAGPRSRLAVGVPGPFATRLLEAAGFSPAWRGYEMERPALPLPPVETPPGMRWLDADRSWAEPLDAALRPAMATVPGSFVPPFAVFAARLEAQPIPTRILAEGGRVAAFVRPEVQGDRGFIGILGRAPWARGLGLGSLALREGMRLLRERGCGSIGLEVAAVNERGLRLYRAHGFEVHDTHATWSKRLR